MSAYATGAPSYDNVSLQRYAIEGRLKVARGIWERAEAAGDIRRMTKWRVIENELLDRLLEVRGR
jgi:hypothetical protein